MKRIMFNVLSAIFLWLASCCAVNAQATGDQITDPNQQIIQDDSSSNGKFQPVTVDAGATSDVKLQFPTSAAGKTVFIQPLDGGTASTNTATIDQNGVLIFSFQVAGQPGVYRVIVIDPNATDAPSKIVGVVQFEVPNPPQ
jgi:redox-sensitive bicupin YhaK (pirin superfamily)